MIHKISSKFTVLFLGLCLGGGASTSLLADNIFSARPLPPQTLPNQCDTCADTRPIADDSVKTLVSISDDLSASAATALKSTQDTENYLHCYRPAKDGDELHKKFLSKYKKQIERAAAIVGMPPSFMMCLYFRESTHWSMKKSPAGAEGIAQLMPDTLKTIEGYINSGPFQASKVKQATDFLSTAKNRLKKESGTERQVELLNEILSAHQGSGDLDRKALLLFQADLQKLRDSVDSVDEKRSASKSELALLRDLNSTLTFVANNLKANELRELWDRYWGGKAKAPKTVDPMNSEQAVMAGALLLKRYLTEIEAAAENHGANLPPTTLYTFLASAYNGGVGTPGKGGFLGTCKPSEGLAICLREMKKKQGQENFNHMVSVRNCMQKDSWEPMSGTRKDEKGCKP